MNRVMVCLAVLGALQPAGAQKVRIDYDHASKFSQYRTYQWAPGCDGQAINQIMQERVSGFIEEALSARQIKRVESGGDLLVCYHTSITERDNFTTFTNGYGPGWGWGWGDSVSYTTVQPLFIGTLTVDLTDQRRKQLVFQGVSVTTMSSKPTKNTKKFAAGVRKIFEKYPPQQ